jgi:acyl-CoA thioesterase II
MAKPPPSAPRLVPRDPLEQLLATLDVQQLQEDLFRGSSPAGGWGRVYGGQVLAQALVAASRTVDPARAFHSLHVYFLVGGTPTKPIDYDVERLRDGGSFSTRRVTALQDGAPIFSMIGSFHAPEAGFAHSTMMHDVPPPEALLPVDEVFAKPDARVPDNMRAYYAQARPIEVRLVETQRYFGSTDKRPVQHFWIKPRGKLPADQVIHNAILAFASDFAMIDTALIPHGRIMFDAGLQLASLDHALWIHAPFRADDWLLYALESPTASHGRGFARGAFYTRAGVLVASVTQEGLIRERKTAFVIK